MTTKTTDLFRASTKELRAIGTPAAKAELERRIAKRAANPAKAKGTVLNAGILAYTKATLAHFDDKAKVAPPKVNAPKRTKAAPAVDVDAIVKAVIAALAK
jgi:hypothetical protein